MASGHAGTEGIRLVPADPDAIRAFVYPLPVKDLDGIGPAHAATLVRFGLDTVGVLANTPLGTVQRILGARVGRRAYDRARGLAPARLCPPLYLPAPAISGCSTATPSTRTCSPPKCWTRSSRSRLGFGRATRSPAP